FERGDFLRFSDLNGDLHKEIQRIAANETIRKLLSAVKSQTVRLQFRAILIPGRPEQSLIEHTAIVDAIVARDPEAAERAMRTHLGGVTQALKQAISMQQIR